MIRSLAAAFLTLLFIGALMAPTPQPAAKAIPATRTGAPQPLRESDSPQSVATTPDVSRLRAEPVPPVAAASHTPKPSGTGARTVGRRVSTSAKAGGVSASPATSSRAVAIRATWYCAPPRSRCSAGYPSDGMFAAISPDLRLWTGRMVRVRYGSASVVVRVIDCNCATEHGIDLYAAAFARLASPKLGVILVTLEVQ